MIVLFHLTFVSLYELYLCFKTRFTNKTLDFENVSDIKVRYNPAAVDTEVGLTFDPPLYIRRYCAVRDVLECEKFYGKIKKAVDFGCAEYGMLRHLKHLKGLQEILFVDVDLDLLIAKQNILRPFNADYLSPRDEPLVLRVLQGSIAYPHSSLVSADAVICVELIEHLYPDVLDSFPHIVFGFIQPKVAVFTTPNSEFNVLFPNFSGFRHPDHKFEWTRQEFQDWANNLALRYPIYSVYFDGVGPPPKGFEHVGYCSQIAVFKRDDTPSKDAHREKLISEIQKKIIPTFKTEFGEDFEDDQYNFCVFCDFDISDFVSNGVCTYMSLSNFKSSQNDCEHYQQAYKHVSTVHYPFEIDNRTEEEKIIMKIMWMIKRLASYRDDDAEVFEIPLEDLVSEEYGKYASVEGVRLLLEQTDLKIEQHVVNNEEKQCVIYKNPQYTSEASSVIDNEWNDESDAPSYGDEDSECWDNPTAENTVVEDDRTLIGDTKLQVIFDPTVEGSSSSVQMIPETISERVSAPECDSMPKRKEVEVLKSDTYVALKKRRAPEPRVVAEVVAPPPVEVEQFRVVENGDLANNNRDREGNNYQAAENVEVVDDNALPRVENLDEDNENHIIENNDVDLDLDEDGLESLDDVSREVLYDPNSDVALSDSALYSNYSFGRSSISSGHELNSFDGFPPWLLELNTDDFDRENDHFADELEHRGQGDGYGLFGTDYEPAEPSEPSSNSLSFHTNQEISPVQDGPSSVSVSAVSSSTDIQFHDALESLDESSSQQTESVLDTARSDTSTFSDAQS